MDGKLECRRGQINALGGGLFYLHDSKTKEKFWVDTGAAVSVLPHTSQKPSTGPPLSGADGKSISSWGSIKKTLNFWRTRLPLHVHPGRGVKANSRC